MQILLKVKSDIAILAEKNRTKYLPSCEPAASTFGPPLQTESMPDPKDQGSKLYNLTACTVKLQADEFSKLHLNLWAEFAFGNPGCKKLVA
jgi:hypothetical protein